MAMMLHYIWLCVFAWLMIESIHLFRMLSELRDVNHGPMRFYYSLGYGLPAIVLGLSVGVRADQYGNYYLYVLPFHIINLSCFICLYVIFPFIQLLAFSLRIRDMESCRTLLCDDLLLVSGIWIWIESCFHPERSC